MLASPDEDFGEFSREVWWSGLLCVTSQQVATDIQSFPPWAVFFMVSAHCHALNCTVNSWEGNLDHSKKERLPAHRPWEFRLVLTHVCFPREHVSTWKAPFPHTLSGPCADHSSLWNEHKLFKHGNRREPKSLISFFLLIHWKPIRKISKKREKKNPFPWLFCCYNTVISLPYLRFHPPCCWLLQSTVFPK